MAFEHACFVSYRHHEQSALAERFLADLCAALRNELTVLVEEDIFVDRERLRGGIFFDPALARALCRSICMVVIYTPTYFSRLKPYCAREYRAMEMLEEKRLSRVQKALARECGLIIPIVLRGVKSLPIRISGLRQFYDFEKFSLTSRELAKNRQFEISIREIAAEIESRKQMLSTVAADVTCDCDMFSIPTEAEAHAWLDTFTVPANATPAPASPFPFRAQAT